MSSTYSASRGRAAPLGATFDGDGVNFAIFSTNASRMTLCLFSEDGKTETQRIELPERDGDVWHGYVSGLRPGQMYGYRAHGPFDPMRGHRFNYNKLLIDPYAKRLSGHPVWHDALMGHLVDHGSNSLDTDLVMDDRDSAPYMPRCIVEDPEFSWREDTSLDTPVDETIVYEAHVKGMTALHETAEPQGKFLGLASDPILEHLTKLGITAIELLPSQAFLNDRFLVEKNLVNYWGYQTLGFFAPEPRYLTQGGIADFRQMVARFHAAGIEVIMDVVYNHTCEGDERGPTLAFRGLDNASYYRLAENPRFYVNDTGTGNTLNVDHPMVLRMIMDSLRYWVEVMHVDGFRFDLCSTLGRTGNGFDRGAAFFDTIRQDPVLAHTKLIAEPWDIGPGGYQLGAYPPPFLEWNDKFRDGVRRFWRGDKGQFPELAERLTGSARQFDHSGRPSTASVNFLTAHDGFTLTDLVSYENKHNMANGEDNKDGHSENFSSNLGVEGLTDDKKILVARTQRRRNMMATLLLSQGTPLILAGDEFGNSQSGNNNAYCQDNEIGWLDWSNLDEGFIEFTKTLIAFRKAHPILRQKLFLHSRERTVDGIEDLFWWRQDGQPMEDSDWQNPDLDLLCVEMRTASGTPEYDTLETAIMIIINIGEKRSVALPDLSNGKRWINRIDTTAENGSVYHLANGTIESPANSVIALTLEDAV
ncbi:MAG: glycogen debranching protein GlgX [Rhizobiaceae bacterium]